ncbi:MAG TPA: hypothetical protein PKK15_13815 [Kouleothrix sp.]|nr:hypothetical protein [Kouleothrix sp.]
MAHKIDVYFEAGEKRTFAGAPEWPGWCRAARDGDAALQALLEYAPRYAQVLKGSGVAFHIPKELDEFVVVERHKGNSTTDFGAPDAALASDDEAVAPAELKRIEALLTACWDAFAAAVKRAHGKELRKGPRGGGRDVDAIVEHVLGAEAGYISRLGIKLGKHDEPATFARRMEQIQQQAFEALAAHARGEAPKQGPRGGEIWTARRFARRSAWHILDHVWEIEDRVEG